MPKPRTLKDLVTYLRTVGGEVKSRARRSDKANATLLEHRIREHIVRDDLPLEALSAEWVSFKIRTEGKGQHLWYTGQYLANFEITPTRGGYVVGTSRPVVDTSFNLPEYLESRFPVWRLTLDETQPVMRRNYGEAVSSALSARPMKALVTK
jgi:hypothetical protein